MSARLLSASAFSLALAVGTACDGRLPAFVAATDAGAAGSGGATPGAGAPGADGGRAGASGAAGAAGGGAAARSGLIDDFEDGDTQPIGGDGWWYARGDDDNRLPRLGIEATPGRTGAMTLALHASGEGYTVWGALVGVDLPDESVELPWFDASAFSEFRFWARAADDSTRELGVQATDLNSKFLYDVEITTTWREYVIPLADFPPNVGMPGSLDVTSITHMQFFVLSREPFDYWLDDVRFR